MRTPLFAAQVVAAALFFPGPAIADVLVVAPSGAPYTTIQAAIDASAEGDTVLVRPGAYAGFQIHARSLSVLADPEGSVFVSSVITVAGLASAQRVLLAGLHFWPETFGGVQASGNAGALRLEALTSLPQPVFSGTAVSLQHCSDVALLRCQLAGADSCMFPCSPGVGLVAVDSRVAVYDSSVAGGKGSDAFYVGMGGSSQPALAGAIGCSLDAGCSFFGSHSTIRGGTGGRGLPGICFPGPSPGGTGASGGIALSVDAGAQAWLLDTLVQGGAGGPGGSGASLCGMPPGVAGPNGADILGSATPLGGPSRTLQCATHLRESNSLALTLLGQPGDLVWIRVAHDPAWTLDLPFQGVRLFAPSARRALLGAVPAGGTLQANLHFGDLGLGVQASTLHLQAIFRDSSGALRLGSGTVLVVLDSAF